MTFHNSQMRQKGWNNKILGVRVFFQKSRMAILKKRDCGIVDNSLFQKSRMAFQKSRMVGDEVHERKGS